MYNFEILQNIFEEYFKPGLDIYKECKITSFEAKKGTTKQICLNENINLVIPPHIKHNDVIILKGRGNISNDNTKRGDLLVKIYVYGSKSKRRGDIIYG